MSDNPNKKRPQDSSRISLSEKWEVEYWTHTLGVSESQLRDAVKTVGNGAESVRKYLSTR